MHGSNAREFEIATPAPTLERQSGISINFETGMVRNRGPLPRKCKYISTKSLPLSLIIDAPVSPECISEIRGTELAIGSREEHSISLEYLQSDSRESTFRSIKPTRWTTGTRLIRFRRNAAYRRPRHTCASTCYHISSDTKRETELTNCQERKSNIRVIL